jgi:hypothetical protein
LKNSTFVTIDIDEVFLYNFLLKNAFCFWNFIGDTVGTVMDGVVSNENKIQEEFKGKIDRYNFERKKNNIFLNKSY